MYTYPEERVKEIDALIAQIAKTDSPLAPAFARLATHVKELAIYKQEACPYELAAEEARTGHALLQGVRPRQPQAGIVDQGQAQSAEEAIPPCTDSCDVVTHARDISIRIRLENCDETKRDES